MRKSLFLAVILLVAGCSSNAATPTITPTFNVDQAIDATLTAAPFQNNVATAIAATKIAQQGAPSPTSSPISDVDQAISATQTAAPLQNQVATAIAATQIAQQGPPSPTTSPASEVDQAISATQTAAPLQNRVATAIAATRIAQQAQPEPTEVIDTAALDKKFGSVLTLTRYFPAGSPVYASVRTDNDYIGSLNSLLSKIQDGLPEGTLPQGTTLSVEQFLDMLSQSALRSPFQSAIRPWLGKSIAAGLLSTAGLSYNNYYGPYVQPDLLAAFEITDPRAAKNAIETMLARQSITFNARQQDNATILTLGASSNPVVCVIQADAVLVGTSSAIKLAMATGERNLMTDPYFTRTLSHFSADNYGIVVYADIARVLVPLVNYYRFQERFAIISLLRLVGSEAIAATLVDNRTLMLDAVQMVGNHTALQDAGFKFGMGSAIDPTFAAKLPESVIMAVHAANLQGLYDTLKVNLGAVVNVLTLQGDESEVGTTVVDGLMRPVNVIVDLVTGLNYDSHIKDWISGDYVIFLTRNPRYSAASPYVRPVDFGVMFGITTEGGGKEIIPALERELPITFKMLDMEYYTIKRESITNADIISIHSPFSDDPADDLLIATTSSSLLIGMRNAVLDTISASQKIPAITEAQGYLLDNAGLAWYWNPQAMRPLLEVMAQNSYQAGQAQTLLTLTDLMSSATASITTLPTGDVLLRVSISLKP